MLLNFEMWQRQFLDGEGLAGQRALVREEVAVA
jgi:hypothetical protein